jgi:transcriptional regulator with XRE-family HTH domain
MTLTGDQCKAARQLLGWTLFDLGYRARVSDSTVMRFEAARLPIRPEKAQAMRAALESAGVEFIAENGGGAGVRLRKVP